jgi:hypothetical protein
MSLFRVRLLTDRLSYPIYRDVEAESEARAATAALKQYGEAYSAQCVGLTAELEARGRQALERGEHA